ncbi:hypothetical protein CCMSSC00406_0006318 [Pleurotus cornucopiae]|uniref:Uncharacterized protein n=1 Tax=Pleurotus cornucopiae TaxID=5321 RepID=A0ACB7IPU3_PLECO|nr:hypothetical protein CCMSSC00406_0006318 [Pleurotus cornucopiae]
MVVVSKTDNDSSSHQAKRNSGDAPAYSPSAQDGGITHESWSPSVRESSLLLRESGYVDVRGDQAAAGQTTPLIHGSAASPSMASAYTNSTSDQPFIARVSTAFTAAFSTPSRGFPLFAVPLDEEEDNGALGGDDGNLSLPSHQSGHSPSCTCSRAAQTEAPAFDWNKPYWKKYFRPMRTLSYYKPLIHLALLDFIFALLAWSYLVTCITTGVSLLFALPLGLIFCFLIVLGARVFARAELALQTYFHGPPVVDSPYCPYTIFTRYRIVKHEELETGQCDGNTRVKETSFLKNTRSMFFDPTSYQALFYFIVIKPAICLSLTLFLLTVIPISFVLVLPAPFLLKTTRRIGVWQANIAVEGLMGSEWYRQYQRL